MERITLSYEAVQLIHVFGLTLCIFLWILNSRNYRKEKTEYRILRKAAILVVASIALNTILSMMVGAPGAWVAPVSMII